MRIRVRGKVQPASRDRLLVAVRWLLAVAIIVLVILDIVGDGIEYTNLTVLILLAVSIVLGGLTGRGAIPYWRDRMKRK